MRITSVLHILCGAHFVHYSDSLKILYVWFGGDSIKYYKKEKNKLKYLGIINLEIDKHRWSSLDVKQRVLLSILEYMEAQYTEKAELEEHNKLEEHDKY